MQVLNTWLIFACVSGVNAGVSGFAFTASDMAMYSSSVKFFWIYRSVQEQAVSQASLCPPLLWVQLSTQD